MANTCKGLILHCLDFQLSRAVQTYLADCGLEGSCDTIAVSGAVKSIVSPVSQHDKDFLMRQIAISKDLHCVSELLLVNHIDCEAYGGTKAFASADEEATRHRADLKAAARELHDLYPDIAIKPLLARLDPHGSVVFEAVE